MSLIVDCHEVEVTLNLQLLVTFGVSLERFTDVGKNLVLLPPRPNIVTDTVLNQSCCVSFCFCFCFQSIFFSTTIPIHKIIKEKRIFISALQTRSGNSNL